jgi:glutathione S-transferase
MRIYWIKAQAPRRVLALVKHLGLDAEFIELDLVGGELKRPEFAKLNPNCKAPVLVDDDGSVLWESSAIMAHLAIKAGSDIWPAADPAGQVEVLRWLSWNDSHWAPAVAPFYFEHIVKGTFGFGPPDRAKLQSAGSELSRYAAVLDGRLAGREHVACDRLTIADFQLASMACDWRACEAPLGGFPNLVRWLDGLSVLPDWADPWPSLAREKGQQALAG